MEVLVVRGGKSETAFAHVVSKEGGRREGVARAVAGDVDLLGRTRVLLKCDQAPALRGLRREVETAWEGEARRGARPSAAYGATERPGGRQASRKTQRRRELGVRRRAIRPCRC